MDRRLDFIVGREIGLRQLLNTADALMLLEGAVRAGACGGEIVAADGALLASCGDAGPWKVLRPILVEGEPVGALSLFGAGVTPLLEGVADMLHTALHTLVFGAMKRLLTSETHTAVINQTYDELLETNRRLAQSERQYRELAETLEIKVHERTKELSRAYAAMLQREKLASVGQLAAGMAHEINNPIGFVISNLATLQRYAAKLKEMLAFYRLGCESHLPPPLMNEANERRQELKIDFILNDLDELTAQSLDGAERVKKLVADLRGFSHVDEINEMPTDLNAELEQTLSVLGHEVREGTVIERRLAPIPRVTLRPALISLAFLNVIRNALQLKVPALVLAISTEAGQGQVRVRIADNGPGIPAGIRNRVFDPFFTTKDVGEGTGMGLNMAYQAVNSCGGTISLECPPGGGTIFTIALPEERDAS
ncbi:histidine kinase [Oryzomonas japonica]|uniref:histidine kinase n=1 Tax=Oryzomonas japonica TaxID=2603858 RepID=A0A7J4ZS44_9BACT|nr:ATP-binding protein [Oryzomonas japonica]KAB0666022.1 histidine kinase [Oryzomonas japonica]